ALARDSVEPHALPGVSSFSAEAEQETEVSLSRLAAPALPATGMISREPQSEAQLAAVPREFPLFDDRRILTEKPEALSQTALRLTSSPEISGPIGPNPTLSSADLHPSREAAPISGRFIRPVSRNTAVLASVEPSSLHTSLQQVAAATAPHTE